MIENNKIIKITNRDNGMVGYTIPDLNNLTRTFAANETKEITMEELRKLSYIPGGKAILKDYLIIQDDEAMKELLGAVEPEYYYTEKDVKNLLLNGSLDALKDCLDYAPLGTIDLVKKIATEIKLNDILKRKAIQEMTGFNIDAAIEINEETNENIAENENKTSRRVSLTEEKENKKTRRVSNNSESKYNVITYN